MAKTKELKKRCHGAERVLFRQFRKPSFPCERLSPFQREESFVSLGEGDVIEAKCCWGLYKNAAERSSNGLVVLKLRLSTQALSAWETVRARSKRTVEVAVYDGKACRGGGATRRWRWRVACEHSARC